MLERSDLGSRALIASDLHYRVMQRATREFEESPGRGSGWRHPIGSSVCSFAAPVVLAVLNSRSRSALSCSTADLPHR
jgi:hypothetical protein